MSWWSVGPQTDNPLVTRMQDLAREMQRTVFPPGRPAWFRAYKAWKDAWAELLIAEPWRLEGMKFKRWERRALKKRGVQI